MSLLDDLVAIPQREQGGSIATERFDFQACWGVSRILSLHSAGGECAVAFEFHDASLGGNPDPMEKILADAAAALSSSRSARAIRAADYDEISNEFNEFFEAVT